jgi:two-component system response regulator GlrR
VIKDIRLLLIDECAQPSPNSAPLVSMDEFSWDCIDIDKISFESLRDCNVHAVVATLLPFSSRSIDLLQWLEKHPIPIPVVAVMPPGQSDLITLAIKATDDFIFTPLQPFEFVNRVRRVIGWKGPTDENLVRKLTMQAGLDQLMGVDRVFIEAIKTIPAIARSEAPTLITGETGTGKDLCARAIHHLSVRRDYPFIAVDCSTLPDHLFENELFGHMRGAYTDAHSDQKGLVSIAQRGTLFLDEIDALSLSAQAKLLRFLQDRKYRPLGSDRFFDADVNIIAATNKDLEHCVRDKQFRADLYYRLNVMFLRLPPLRERPDDIELLANHFLQKFGNEPSSTRRMTLSRAALGKLRSYSWPGNVRELANIIQRAVWTGNGSQILPDEIHLTVSSNLANRFRDARQRVVASFERSYIEQLLRKHAGNVTRAAQEAGKERRAFGRLLKKYDIRRSSHEPSAL